VQLATRICTITRVPKDVELDAGTRAALFSYVQSSTMVFARA
jgi:hypothetical protein